MALYSYGTVACINYFSLYMRIFQPASWTIFLQMSTMAKAGKVNVFALEMLQLP